MAESKRPSNKRGLLKMRRLSTADLALNAVLMFVAAPALVVAAVMLFQGQFGGTETNQHLFLGGVCLLLAVFILVLNGLKLREHVQARKRFRELLDGASKKGVMQNVDELNTLARALGPPYRRRLEARLDELGVKR